MAVLLATALTLNAPAVAAPEQQGWTTWRDPKSLIVFDYPAGIFSVEKGDPTASLAVPVDDKAGRIFTTSDGRAILQIATFPNKDNATVDDLRKRAAAASYRDAKIEYNRAGENWYVLSGRRGTDVFYERTQFNCRGTRLDLFALTYPAAEGNLYDAIVDEMARRARTVYSRIRCP